MPSEHGAELVWPVKSGFVAYVSALPDGAIALGDGARREGEAFVFPEAGEGPASSASALGFAGSAIFTGYRGVLAVRVREPWIELSEGGGEITIVHPELLEPSGLRCAIAAFSGDPAAGTVIPELTLEGARMFGDTYPVGQPLDPFLVRAPICIR